MTREPLKLGTVSSFVIADRVMRVQYFSCLSDIVLAVELVVNGWKGAERVGDTGWCRVGGRRHPYGVPHGPPSDITAAFVCNLPLSAN